MKSWILASLSAVVLFTPLPVVAQSCDETLTALFTTGSFNPFNRPSWKERTVQITEDGTETHVVDATWQDPTRVLSFSNGSYSISVGSQMWTSTSEDGPWTAANAILPEDMAEFHRLHNEALMRNMTDVSCPGTEVIDGREMAKYIYRTQTDPNEYGSWFGGLYTSYVDAETGLLMRVEIRESIASWAPNPAEGVNVTVLEYDPTIKVDPPE